MLESIQQQTMFFSALKPTSAKVLLYLIWARESVAASSLASVLGMSRQSIAPALQQLEALGLVQNHGNGSQGQWALTVSARQFILGESDPILVDGSVSGVSVKNFYTSLASSSSLNNGSLNVAPLEITATSSSVKKVNTSLDDDGEAAVTLLQRRGIAERLRSGKGARDSVECAVAAGWSGAQCLECVEGWLAYAESPEGRKKVRSAAAMAAYQVRERVMAPVVMLSEDDPRRYVTGAYADVIQH